MTEKLYLNYLNKALSYYHSDDLFIKYFGNVPKSRDITFKICLDHINNKNTELNNCDYLHSLEINKQFIR